ncbi:MAG: adenosylcobinamide-phosphate synthase CbiB [Coriobacteriia bacterium]|nr:adenosylcobinamide-phosphate synthase CbiB [Coriobacteriia bacterium]
MHWAVARAIVLLVALILDLIIGDPENRFHPIRIIGNIISLGIKLYRRTMLRSSVGQFLLGTVLTISVITLFFTLSYLLIKAAYALNAFAGIALESVTCYFMIACKCLKVESMKVCRSLVSGEIVQARHDLSMIVGRDTASLGEEDIVKATVETVAENFSDGVIAPLFYICLGGASLGVAYKTINTLDSMIGYKTDEFLFFGRFAARLDDLANYLPARISALMLILASTLTGADFKQAAKVFVRDRRNHASPNSAQSMSACAGALGLQLGGDTSYHGQLVHKPTIGEQIYALEPIQIIKANRLMYSATFCAALLMMLCIVSSWLWAVFHV